VGPGEGLAPRGLARGGTDPRGEGVGRRRAGQMACSGYMRLAQGTHTARLQSTGRANQ
jgi:hypothetical protein